MSIILEWVQFKIEKCFILNRKFYLLTFGTYYACYIKHFEISLTLKYIEITRYLA